jgi:hypothetical protein
MAVSIIFNTYDTAGGIAPGGGDCNYLAEEDAWTNVILLKLQFDIVMFLQFVIDIREFCTFVIDSNARLYIERLFKLATVICRCATLA